MRIIEQLTRPVADASAARVNTSRPSEGLRLAMPLEPLRAGPAHVVQLRPITSLRQHADEFLEHGPQNHPHTPRPRHPYAHTCRRLWTIKWTLWGGNVITPRPVSDSRKVPTAANAPHPLTRCVVMVRQRCLSPVSVPVRCAQA